MLQIVTPLSLKIRKLVHLRRAYLALFVFGAGILGVIVIGVFLFRPAHAESNIAPGTSPSDFVTTWTTNTDGSSDSTIMIPASSGSTYNYEVDWNNDGIFEQSGITGSVTHDFGAPGTYTIRVRGVFPRIQFGGQPYEVKRRIISIDQWGTQPWTSMAYAFQGATNLKINAIDSPNLSNVTDMTFMLAESTSLNGDLSNWDTSNVTNMSVLFSGSSAFNADISNWDTSKVTDMSGMFRSATAFNADLSNWNTSNVTDMKNMFDNATSFNRDLSQWDTSKVTDMSGMFRHAVLFNADISSWDTGSVTNMQMMFNEAAVFNADIANWDTSKVTDMTYMFREAPAFDRNLSSWDLTSASQLFWMFAFSGLSVANYDALLVGWSEKSLPHDIDFSVHGLKYCTSSSQRQSIIDEFGWSFAGDAVSCHVTINNTDNVQIYDNSLQGSVIGTLGVVDFIPRVNSPYTLSCASPGEDDHLFAVSGSELRSNTMFSHSNPADADGDNVYNICIQAKNATGVSIESRLQVIVKAAPGPKKIHSVAFSEGAGKKLLSVTGEHLVGADDPDEYAQAMTRSLVSLNGRPLPFCTENTGGDAALFVEMMNVSPSLVSDVNPCYFLIGDEAGSLVLTPAYARIWLPDNFDTSSQGTISVNGSPEYTFNQQTNPGVDEPTATVESESLVGDPVIPKRPHFSGTAEPGATVIVTVHSDPISCSTIADSSGNWSCQLPSDLEPGQHTVYIHIILPGGATQDLGPYSVTVVSGRTNSSLVNTTPLAPNTGFAQTVRALTMQTQGLIILATVLAVLGVGMLAIREQIMNRRAMK
ncbi:TPA: BspA family leucine-rich repeat surface protein [Candidatus Saccharibacteria bacterium]|nr:MAG: lipoprotein [Candidatus Saccharibacteria bacterium GW2011_GWC2_44_17]HBH78110.1 BspA family leucine-rich repeat surface protein [Candidatus Saccharibacteria bacterium]